MSVRRHKAWYVASIGGLSACSHDRREAMHMVLAMFVAGLESTCPP